MKIELNDWQDVQDFIALMNPAYLREWNKQLGPDATTVAAGIRRENVRNAQHEVEVSRRLVAEGKITPQDALAGLAHLEARVSSAVEPDGLPTDIAQPAGITTTNEPGPVATDELPERDADGARYDTRWHSEPKKLTDKGVFRARRGRDNDAYKAWLLEQAVEVAEAAIAADEAEPVATETHALPAHLEEMELVNDEMVPLKTQEGESDPRDGSAVAHGALPATTTVNLDALIAASLEAAQDASDSHVDLLNACRDFTSKHGHPAFTALKAAVAPDDAGSGKAVQYFTPGERRLMQACIANYPSN